MNTVQEKDAAVIKLAMDVLEVVRKSESPYYAIDALAVAAALMRPYFPAES